MASGKFADWQRRQLSIWVAFECVLPLFLIISLWPIAEFFIQGVDRPFLRIFSTADLVVFSALLFLSMYKDIEGCIDQGILSRNKFFRTKLTSLVLAVLLLFSYGFMKNAALFAMPLLSESNEAPTLTAIARTSILSAVVAVAFCFGARWKIIEVLESENR